MWEVLAFSLSSQFHGGASATFVKSRYTELKVHRQGHLGRNAGFEGGVREQLCKSWYLCPAVLLYDMGIHELLEKKQ